MRKAVIDLGTNTFNLLISEHSNNSFQTLYTDKKGVGFGLGGINDGILAADAQLRAHDALKDFKNHCDDLHVQKIIALGTSALRSAKNASDFIAKVNKELNIEIRTISGEEEATLIYQGVKQSFKMETSTVIMDIGGGSTEFILGNNITIDREVSLNIGISRIYQAVLTEDPMSENDIKTIEDWMNIQVNDRLNGFECPTLVGASGSFETYYEMINNKKFVGQNECYRFDLNELNEIIDWLIHSDRKQRENHDYIIPIRKIMGPISALQTRWAMKKLGVKEVWLSPYSLKEGAMVLYE